MPGTIVLAPPCRREQVPDEFVAVDQAGRQEEVLEAGVAEPMSATATRIWGWLDGWRSTPIAVVHHADGIGHPGRGLVRQGTEQDVVPVPATLLPSTAFQTEMASLMLPSRSESTDQRPAAVGGELEVDGSSLETTLGQVSRAWEAGAPWTKPISRPEWDRANSRPA